jgi:hypothetical protein
MALIDLSRESERESTKTKRMMEYIAVMMAKKLEFFETEAKLTKYQSMVFAHITEYLTKEPVSK